MSTMSWEYRSVNHVMRERLDVFLTRMSEQGWDFHSHLQGEYIFRRAKIFEKATERHAPSNEKVADALDTLADRVGAPAALHALTRENLGMGPGREVTRETTHVTDRKGERHLVPGMVVESDSAQVGSDPFDAVFVLLAELQGYTGLTATSFERSQVMDSIQRIREKLIQALGFGGKPSLFPSDRKFVLGWIAKVSEALDTEEAAACERDSAFFVMEGAFEQIRLKMLAVPPGPRRDPRCEDEAVDLIDKYLDEYGEELHGWRPGVCKNLEAIRAKILETSAVGNENDVAYAFLRTITDQKCSCAAGTCPTELGDEDRDSWCEPCNIKARWEAYSGNRVPLNSDT